MRPVMDRRLFLTGLLSVAGTAALATAMPRQAGAAIGDPLAELRPPRPEELPEWELAEEPEEEGVEVAQRGEWRPRSGGGRRSRRRGRRYGRRSRRHWRRYGRRRHRHWRRHRPYYRRRYRYWDDGYYGGYRGRCRWVVNRWGEWVRRCYRPPGFGFGVWF